MSSPLLARCARIKDPTLRILLVTLLWPWVLLELHLVALWHGRWPSPGMAATMYDVACGGLDG